MSLQVRAAALAFLTGFVTLFMQILIHRMVSAKLLNNYAFLVISLTMLGFALSGVLLSHMLPRFLRNLNDTMAASASLFTLSALCVCSVFYQIDIDTVAHATREELIAGVLTWIPYAALFAVPFTFAGLILGVLLGSPDLPARRIYCFDLAGSALGALLVLPAITALGVERSALAACAALPAAACALGAPVRSLPRLLVACALLAVAAAAVWSDRVFDMRYPKLSMLGLTQQPGSGYTLEYVAWDPIARIEVSRIPPPDPRTMPYPSLIGEDRAFLARFKRLITQNNYAFTYAVEYDGSAASLKGIERTIYAAGYAATSVQKPRVLVIGVGGGFDILAALAHDASYITAAEINAATVGILTRSYRDYFRHWIEDPRLHLVQEEGRHFLATADAHYDVIQLSGVDSYSGTPGAAHVFSENYLYTAEAFDLYLSRLSEQGIVNMMRLEFPLPREMLRALTTAVAALRRAGARHPADHIMMLTQAPAPIFTAMLVKKTPFSEAERRRLEAWAAGNRTLGLSAAPQLNPQLRNPYQVFLSLDDPRKEAAYVSRYPFDIAPVDDDRPFFFRYSSWKHLFPDDPVLWRAVIPVMEYSVLILGSIIGLAALLCVLLPLRFLAAQGFRTRHRARYVVYFAGTGIAYLAIEIALMQKFGLFLGHPNYALSVVLAALLVSTGLGSLWSGAIVGRLGTVRHASYVLALAILLVWWLVLPLLPGLIGLPFWLRALIAVSAIAPIGLCLGVFFPTALEQLKGTGSSSFVPWAWGINGVFSVLGPVIAIAFSITWGINAVLLGAIPVYLIAALSLPGSRAAAHAAR